MNDPYRDDCGWYRDDQYHVTVAGLEPQTHKPKYKLNLLLFLLTVLSTLLAGAFMVGANPLTQPWLIWKGMPFSFSLLCILGVHEFGHYYASRRWNVDASLPYFIPLPPPLFFLGTMGAFIKVKSRIVNRRALIDIGAAGPFIGCVASIAALVIGLKLSTPVDPGAMDQGSIELGESLLFSAISRITVGPETARQEILLHPIAFAGWLGLFVTALNLLPIGQLDGGHIAFALLGDKHRYLAGAVFLALFPLGFWFWPGWFVWIAVALLTGLRHPPPLDNVSPLDRKRRILGILALALFVLCFIPEPIRIR